MPEYISNKLRGLVLDLLLAAGLAGGMALPIGISAAASGTGGIGAPASPPVTDSYMPLPASPVSANCVQTPDRQLDCEYRLVEPRAISSISATIDGTVLPAPTIKPFPYADSSTAILFVVDTSDARSQLSLNRSINHLQAILEKAEPHHLFGLANFDSTFRVDAPMGSSPNKIRERLQYLETSNNPSEFYRCIQQAVHYLNDYPAHRKMVLVLSAGHSDDRAYSHQDVAVSAQRSRIAVSGIGYPASRKLVVELQTLRRLAEDTGGQFVAATVDGTLSSSYLSDPFAAIDSGGRLSFSLAQLESRNLAVRHNVVLRWHHDDGVFSKQINIDETRQPTVPLMAAGVPQKPAMAATPPDTQAPNRTLAIPVTHGRQLANGQGWVMILAYVATGLAVIIFGLAWFRRQQTRPPRTGVASNHDIESAGPGTERSFLALLEMLDGSGVRHPVNSTPYTIGRHPNNDLVLDDDTVSRHHAEIVNDGDNHFIIRDKDSINGVLVNGIQKMHAVLSDRDRIEIGDIPLRFVLAAGDIDGDSSTIVLKDRPPTLESLADDEAQIL